MGWSRETEVCVRVCIEDGGSNGIDEKRTKLVPHVDAIIPQMRFADECFGEADSRLPADGICGVVVWVYVVFERWDSFHDDKILWCFVCLYVCVDDVL